MMKSIFYAMCMLLSMHAVFATPSTADGKPIPSDIIQASAMIPPYLLDMTLYVDQTFARFGVENNNDRGVTEVWRSLSPDSGYVLIGTYTQRNEQFYVEQANLKPRTTYWYKLRATDGAESSVFTEAFEVTTYSIMYPPTIIAHAVDGTTIDIELVDKSYNDLWYVVERERQGFPGVTTVMEVQALDSGHVFTASDSFLEPGATYIYTVTVGTYGEGFPSYVIATASETTLFEAPILTLDLEHSPTCGTRVPMIVTYSDSNPSTEIYHALSPDGPFNLIATLPANRDYFEHYGVPRTVNYYKARAVATTAVSDFSNVISYAARSAYYEPQFSVTAQDDHSVEIKIADNSYADEWYHVSRLDHTPEGEFHNLFTISMSDSGRIHTFIDTTLAPGSRYTYFLTGKTTEWCSGWPGAEGEYDIAELDVETLPNDYTITGFTLVDPITDQDIGPLVNGAYFEASNLPNIRANTGPKVKSVIFFLNNKRRTDNGAPIFSYWPEKNGDYQPGAYEEGHYVLQVTAYSEKNGGGIAGETVYLNFDIKASSYVVNSFTLVDPVTDQDIGALTDGAIVDASLAANIRANTTSNVNAVMFFLNKKRRADNGSSTFTYFPEKHGDYQPGLTTPGHYILEATPSSLPNGRGNVGATVTIEFDVVATPFGENANAQKVDLYPNPIVHESQILVRANPQSMVSIQVYDQFGNPIGTTRKSTTDINGALEYPVARLNLQRGAYIINVMIDGQRHMKRVIVD